jgi:Domain of unknown function (DUF1772)
MKISTLILWIFAAVLSVEVGAGLYETLVIIPMWMGGAPESVVKYYELYAANPQFALRAGPKFWMFLTPSVGIFALATLLSSFKTSPHHRKWRLIASGLSVFIVTATFAWFVPNVLRLTNDVPTMSATDIAHTAKWWVNLNYIRCVLAVAAMLFTFRTLSISDE